MRICSCGAVERRHRRHQRHRRLLRSGNGRVRRRHDEGLRRLLLMWRRRTLLRWLLRVMLRVMLRLMRVGEALATALRLLRVAEIAREAPRQLRDLRRLARCKALERVRRRVVVRRVRDRRGHWLIASRRRARPRLEELARARREALALLLEQPAEEGRLRAKHLRRRRRVGRRGHVHREDGRRGRVRSRREERRALPAVEGFCRVVPYEQAAKPFALSRRWRLELLDPLGAARAPRRRRRHLRRRVHLRRRRGAP
mmetsp:Transcript_37194/g.78366  ORF Transcript_37194/g.78366 Transcript_37194/m.78366 type:complete len:256 (-) Transcript_37194:297-1064(-)